MKCPKCGENLKDSAKVCYACGEDISNASLDDLIDDMIKEDMKSEKPPKKKTEPVVESSKTYGPATRITRYIAAGIILLMMLTLLLPWFSFSGRGAYLGFETDTQTIEYMTDTVQSMDQEAIMNLDESVVLYTLSPKKLIQFVGNHREAYAHVVNTSGEEKKSWATVIQYWYIQGFWLIIATGIISIIILFIDRKLKAMDWVRGFSVLTGMIVVLNYVVLKIPFFSMIAIHAQSALRARGTLSAVKIGLKGIQMNNEFYPYTIHEQYGFILGIIFCILWFVFSTVLIEMRKERQA